MSGMQTYSTFTMLMKIKSLTSAQKAMIEPYLNYTVVNNMVRNLWRIERFGE